MSMQATAAPLNTNPRPETDLASYVMASEAAMRARIEDYDAALQHLREARVDELVAIGCDPWCAGRIVQVEATLIAQDAMEAGADPATRIYAYALARGYRPPGAGHG